MSKGLRRLLLIVPILFGLQAGWVFAQDEGGEDKPEEPKPTPQGIIEWINNSKATWTISVFTPKEEPFKKEKVGHTFTGGYALTGDTLLKANVPVVPSKIFSNEKNGASVKLKRNSKLTPITLLNKSKKDNKCFHLLLSNGENSAMVCFYWNADGQEAKLFLEQVNFTNDNDFGDFIELNKPTGGSFTIK